MCLERNHGDARRLADIFGPARTPRDIAGILCVEHFTGDTAHDQIVLVVTPEARYRGREKSLNGIVSERVGDAIHEHAGVIDALHRDPLIDVGGTEKGTCPCVQSR